MSQDIKSENVNNSFFDGHYKDIWRHIFPEKTTLAETTWIINEGDLNPGDHVLDIMCGHGRHCLELGRRGIAVTAVDNLRDYVNEINNKAKVEKLVVHALCEDVLEMKLDQQYDAVICMGNSLQFFNEEQLLKLLSCISAHVKPGGMFFINTWSIAEIALTNFKEIGLSRFGDLLFQMESKLLYHPTRIEMKSLIITDSGEREEKTGIDFIYSISELEEMLYKTGFRLTKAYSIPGKKLFTAGEPRAYIVAEKI